MIATAVLLEHADRDTIMSWLQDREMKDRKLGDARSGRVRSVDITTAIDRLRESAYTAFPNTDRHVVDAFVREYIDPFGRVPEKL